MRLAAARCAVRRRGPEAGALRMALWLAFFNQAFASTAIINCERAEISFGPGPLLYVSRQGLS